MDTPRTRVSRRTAGGAQVSPDGICNLVLLLGWILLVYGLVGLVLDDSPLAELSRRLRYPISRTADPNWKGISGLDADTRNELLDGISPAYYDLFIDANSFEDALNIRKRILDKQGGEYVNQLPVTDDASGGRIQPGRLSQFNNTEWYKPPPKRIRAGVVPLIVSCACFGLAGAIKLSKRRHTSEPDGCHRTEEIQ